MSRHRIDVRRLPLSEQVAAVRHYHFLRARDRNEDPFLTVEDVRRKFRCICPEGLFAAYSRDCDVREATATARRVVAIRAVLSDGGWHRLRGRMEEAANRTPAIERRRIPVEARCFPGERGYEFRLKGAP